MTPAQHEQRDQDAGQREDRREREEMFTIAPELLAGGALPRRSDGSRYVDAGQPRRQPRPPEGGS